MLRDYENGRLGRRPDPGQVTPSVGVGNSFVKVTGTNAAYPAGDYVGEFTWFDTSDGLWHSQFDPVRVREVNGATLTVGSKYVGESVETIAGIEIFAVQASGGGGAAGSELVFVKSTGVASWYTTGVISTLGNAGSAIQPATWIDGTTVIGIQELNQNIIPTGKRMLAMKVTAAAGGSVYIVGLDPEAVTSVVCNSGTLTIKKRT